MRQGVLLRAARNAVGQNDLPLALLRFDELFEEFPQPSDVRFEWVGVLISAGKLEEAEKELATLTQDDPTNMDFQSRYSDLLLQRGKYELAERSLRELVNSGAGSVEAIATLAHVLAWRGKKQEATELYFQRLLNIGRVSTEADMRIARLLMEIDRPSDAVQIINRLLEQQPSKPELAVELVLAWTRIGAEAEMQQSLAMLLANPYVSAAQRMSLADTLYNEGHLQSALLLYQQIVASDSTNLEVQAKIIRTYVRVYDFPAAQATIASLSGNGSNRLVRLETANFNTAIGEHAAAFAIYKSLLALDANDANAVKGMGVLMHAITDYPRAESYLRRGLRISTNDMEMRQLLAEALMKQKRVNEAVELLIESKGSVAGKIDQPQTAPMIADLLVRGGEYATAESICRSSLAAVMDVRTQANLRTTFAFSLLQQGHIAEALDAFAQAKLLPGGDSPKLRYGLYACFARLEQPQKAEAAIASELRTFGPQTMDRVVIAGLAMQDCNGVLAERLLQQALMFDSSNVFVMVMLAEARAMVDRCSGGCQDRQLFEQALLRAPDGTRARLGLARSLSRTNDFELGHKQYSLILQSFPDHDLARIERARMTYAWKGADLANCEYAAAESRFRPQDFLPEHQIGEKSLSVLESAYEQAGLKLQSIKAERDGKYNKSWRPQTAVLQFKMLSELDQTNQEALFDFAQLQSILGRTPSAIASYDQLLALDSCHLEARTAKRRLELEQGPQWLNSIDFEYRSGRQGLTDITTLRLESLGVKPYGDSDEYFVAGYAHRFLRPRKGIQVDGNSAILGIYSKPLDQLRFHAVAELQVYDVGFSTRPTFETGLQWRTPGDAVIGLNGFSENVAENGESIRQDINRVGLDVYVSKLVNWRWEIGGNYRFAGYSDNNIMSQFGLTSDYLLQPGRNQWRVKTDASYLTYRDITLFSSTPGNLVGTVHPYFAPEGFGYMTGGLEFRTWLSPHNFRGADEHWYSIYAGARIDSDSVGYGLGELRAHRDWCGWASAHFAASAITSEVYTGIGVSGLITLRMP
jgi:tetratricopeptide (TPR) repeat protein